MRYAPWWKPGCAAVRTTYLAFSSRSVNAAMVKNVFRKLIATELERAAAALGLGAPDGIKWQTI